MNIGKIHKLVFKDDDGNVKEEKLRARIKTRQLNIECFLIENGQKASDQAPDYKIIEIVRGGEEIELGAAWIKRSKRTMEEYLSLSIDEQSFEKPLYAYAFKQGEGHWDIVWNRPKPKQEEAA